jgi:inosine/xanthosine triphosphatase
MVRVTLGSKNPVKIKAVEEAFKGFFENVEIIPIEINSIEQPFNHQMVSGARIRSQDSLVDGADYSVGLEGGVIELYGVHYLTAFCSVLSKEGETHGGWGPFIEMPQEIITKMNSEGKELGEIMDNLFGRENIKHQEGAFGIFTKGKITRKDSLKEAVITALARFL